MDNCDQRLTEALRELVKARDCRLGPRTLSPEILAQLNDCLAAQFPVETAFRALGIERDHSLDQTRLDLSPKVSETLIETARLRAKVTRDEDYPFTWRRWIRVPSYVGLAAAVVLTLAWIVGARHYQGPVRGGQNSPQAGRPNQGESFTPSGEIFFVARVDRLNLEAARIELASLQPSRMALNAAYLIEQTDAGVRLDLPLEQIIRGTNSIWGP